MLPNAGKMTPIDYVLIAVTVIAPLVIVYYIAKHAARAEMQKSIFQNPFANAVIVQFVEGKDGGHTRMVSLMVKDKHMKDVLEKEARRITGA